MVTRNPLLIGARGGLGKVVVFKQMYGKTVMTNYPRKVDIPREKQSAAQRGTRDNFRDAVAYAKAALKDPVRKAYYEKKKKQLRLSSAYQAAITDYMRQLKPAVKPAVKDQSHSSRAIGKAFLIFKLCGTEQQRRLQRAHRIPDRETQIIDCDTRHCGPSPSQGLHLKEHLLLIQKITHAPFQHKNA